MGSLRKFDVQQGAGAEELFRLQAVEHIGDRQVEGVDREQRSIIKRDQRPAAAHEGAQSFHAGLTDTARVLAGNGAGGEAFHDGAGRGVGDDDRVEAFE